MAVRNFWIDANIDGRETELAGGPRSKDGGMDVVIKQRDCGKITTAVKIRCFEYEGKLTVEVSDGKTNEVVFERETER